MCDTIAGMQATRLCILQLSVLSILKQIGAEIGEFFANVMPIHFQDWPTFTPIRGVKKGLS
jgi:hypothetical protein